MVAKAQLAKCELLIRAEYDKEKAEFGLSVHESAVAMTLKEVGEWLSKKTAVHGRLKGSDWKSFKKGEMP